MVLSQILASNFMEEFKKNIFPNFHSIVLQPILVRRVTYWKTKQTLQWVQKNENSCLKKSYISGKLRKLWNFYTMIMLLHACLQVPHALCSKCYLFPRSEKLQYVLHSSAPSYFNFCIHVWDTSTNFMCLWHAGLGGIRCSLKVITSNITAKRNLTVWCETALVKIKTALW